MSADSASANRPAVPLKDERRKLIARGVFWNSAFQIFVAAINFVSMLVLVRVIAPAEYGRAAAATGVLALLNCFNSSYFIAQAIQLGDREHPDWETHWRAGFRIQFVLTILCNLVAACLWLSDTYRTLAPLLHLASLGLLVDTPNQISLTMLRREMDYKRLRLATGTGVVITAVASIVLGLRGLGAAALIIGSNVLHGLPLGFHLLFVRRWRPLGGWLASPDWTNYRAALRFGAQLSGTAVLTALRGLLEAVVLPRAIGYEAIGLLNRAQVLFATTFGRINGLIVDTVYPLLPRSAHDPVQFSRHATLVVQAMLLFSIPGAAFVLIEGPTLSRLLYSTKWIAADPLIAPGTLVAWGVAVALVFSSILLAANRLKISLAVSVATACLGLPAIIVAFVRGDTLTYAWTLAGGQCLAVMVAMMLCSSLLERGWIWRAVLPPSVSSAIGGVALFGLNHAQLDWPLAMRLVVSSTIFGLVILTVLRVGFAKAFQTVTARLPGGERWLRWLRLCQG